ncbi:MAG: rolling circle replication-associated protein [Methylophilaceae bacterium]
MTHVLPRTKEVIQQEILNLNGYKKYRKLTVHDFGGNNVEFSLMPWETWSEISEEDLYRPFTERGKGDRQKSIESSIRRSRRRVRHLCKLLNARYMVTLTTQEIITDKAVMQKYFQEFVRRIRKVNDFQYVATLELQKRGALHMHIAVGTRQCCKLLWSIWLHIIGKDKGRVHVTKEGKGRGARNRIASYISKYIAKSFEDGELNKKRYWASKNIGHAVKTIHLLRPDWPIVEVLLYIKELCEELKVNFSFECTWQNLDEGLFWMATTS